MPALTLNLEGSLLSFEFGIALSNLVRSPEIKSSTPKDRLDLTESGLSSDRGQTLVLFMQQSVVKPTADSCFPMSCSLGSQVVLVTI